VPVATELDEIRPAYGFGGLLRQRDFRLLWTGETASQIGTSMAAVGVPLLAVAVLRVSTFAVSALTAAEYLPWLIIGLPAGAWVDRLPARPLMIACDIVSALVYASLPVAAWAGLLSTVQVLVVALLGGAGNVFFSTAYQRYLLQLVRADELMEGNAKLQASVSVADISGGSAAGLAAQTLGYATAVLFNAGSFLVSAVCLLNIRVGAPPHVAPEGTTTTIRTEISEGARLIVRDPFLRPIAMFTAAANLAYAGTTALEVVFLIRVAGFRPTSVGLLIAAGGVGGIAGAIITRRMAQRHGTARMLLLTALGSGAAGLLLPLARPGPAVAFFITGVALMGAAKASGSIIIVSFRQAYCPPGMLGRIIAGQRVLVYGTIPLGALLAGGLGTAFGVRNALWAVLGMNALSGTFLLTYAIRSAKNLPSAAFAPSRRHQLQSPAPGSRPRILARTAPVWHRGGCGPPDLEVL